MRELDKPFLMPIEDVFSITGRGTVVTGKVEQGVVHTGDEIEIVGIKATQKTTCTGVEMFRKLLDEGQAGDNIGALLRGTKKEEVERGQVLCKPGSITPHTDFEGQVYVLTKEEGGRHKPFFANYRPQFYFRTTDVTGTVELPEGTEMCMPGDNTLMKVQLDRPDRHGRGPALRHPRRRPHRRRRPRHQDHQVGERTMAKANEKRIAVTLECTQCKRRNYITEKNKVNDRERIEMKKYCRWERTHTLHKETQVTTSQTTKRVRTLAMTDPTGQAELVARAREGDQAAFEELVRATYADTYTLAEPPDRQRGGCERRGPGVVPAGLSGAEALPWRRAVHDLAVPHHRELREHPHGQAVAAAHRGPARRLASIDANPERDPVRPGRRRPAARAARGRPRRPAAEAAGRGRAP